MHILRTFSRKLDNQGKITFAVIMIIVLAAFVLAGGFFSLDYSPLPPEDTSGPSSDGNTLQFGNSQENTQSPQNATAAPINPIPGTVCPKYQNMTTPTCTCQGLPICNYEANDTIAQCYLGTPYCNSEQCQTSIAAGGGTFASTQLQDCNLRYERGQCETIQCVN